MDIKPTKLVKGHGLTSILSEENFQALSINLVAKNSKPEKQNKQENTKREAQKTKMKYLIYEWYKFIVHYLLFLECPPKFDRAKYRSLRLQEQKFCIFNG